MNKNMRRGFGICVLFYGLSLFAAGEALLHAAKKGDLEAVRTHIHYATVAMDEDGCTPLHWAIENRQEAVARYLINRAPVLVNRVAGDGITPVFLAIELKLYDIALQCIAAGAEVNRFVHVRGYRAETALHMAALHGHAPTLLALLRVGADIYSRYWVNNQTALHLAAEHGHSEAVQVLLAYGTDVDIQDSRGYTPLMRASLRGHVEAIEILVNAGAPMDIRPSELILHHGGGDNAPNYRCHDLIQFMATCWWIGAARYVTELTALAAEIEGEGIVAFSDEETLAEFKRGCLEPAIRLLRENVRTLDLANELTDGLRSEVIAFVAAQEDVDAALRFARAHGLVSMSDFLRSIGAQFELGCTEEDSGCLNECGCSIL